MFNEGCMGSSRSTVLGLAVAILFLCCIGGCGGGSKSGAPIFPAKVNLVPGGNTSVQLGVTFSFSAAAQSASGTNISTTFTYSSSDTSVLNVAPNGVACAGHWDVAFTTCTPGGIGAVQVTAMALGVSSAPTYVFVHPPVDSIIVTGVLLDGLAVQEPCLSQSQSMTVEAHAFSQGTDVTSAVGPFTWTAQNPSVVSLAPLVNSAYNFATNQATATAATPGITQIYASASGVNSSSFHQPQYQNSHGNSPSLDFFATCPIQTINLQIGPASQQTGQTSFITSRSSTTSTVTATAIVTDIMGSSSLANTNSGVVLSKIPLTWSATQPGVVSAASTCQQSCSLTIQGPGSGFVTASCSPPSCNVGFPVVPSTLSTQTDIQNCTQFFAAQYPQFQSCAQLIPFPVYATPLPLPPPQKPLPGDGSISGLVTGAPSAATVLATSTGCAHLPPSTCTTAMYSVSTGKATPGPENSMSSSPNSLLFDAAGDRAYAGSDYGALLVNAANFGTSSSPFTGLGTVTGQVLAVSNNGSSAVFSDTIHLPNQVYIVSATSSGALSASALNISGAVAASFSPDGLKAFIFGNGGGSLYVYSPLQALQGPFALSGPANAGTATFSPNGAFAFVAEAAANANSASLTAFNTCNNQVAESPATPQNTPVPAILALPANPLFVKILPGLHINGADSSGQPFPDGLHILVLDATGFNIITANGTPPTPSTPLAPTGLCPQTLTFVSNPPTPAPPQAQRVELGQGTLQPINIFPSADGTLLYILAAGHASVLVYDFGAGSINSAIDLAGNATPLSADISADGGTIAIAGSDGLLHEISTNLGGSDQVQLSFPNLPDYLNPFCSFSTCSLNLVAVKP